MGKFVIFCFFVLFSLNSEAESSNLRGKIGAMRPYLTPIDVSTNKVAIKAQEQVKNALNGEDFTIPKTWRLVSVINKKENHYIMFFQDNVSNSVFSLSVDGSGHLSGQDLIYLEAKTD